MPKNNTTNLKKDKQRMIRTGQTDNNIVKQIDHKKLAKQSSTFKKHHKQFILTVTFTLTYKTGNE